MRTLVPIFAGRVDEHGVLTLLDRERVHRKQWLQTLAGKDVEVLVRKKRTQRSLDQNAYFHAIPVPLLAEEWGEDVETAKLLILGECFGWRDMKDGRQIPIKPSSSALTVDEFSHLIEWLPPWAMTHFRVEIPLPEKAAAA